MTYTEQKQQITARLFQIHDEVERLRPYVEAFSAEHPTPAHRRILDRLTRANRLEAACERLDRFYDIDGLNDFAGLYARYAGLLAGRKRLLELKREMQVLKRRYRWARWGHRLKRLLGVSDA